MGDDLREFGGLYAVVEREAEMVRHFNRLIARDQDGHCNDAAVAR